MKMIRSKLILGVLLALGSASVAWAQGESASGTVSGLFNGSSYDYTITLNNTSSSGSIGSFWYSWTPNIPPFFYLPSTPSSATAPAGWSAFIDGTSIQYTSSGSPLAPLQSIQFHYNASFTPAQLTGNAGYSYVYTGGIEGDPGAFVNIVTVPEPASLGLLTAGVLGLVWARRKLRN
jgi:PEP-CTERM motif